VEIIDAAIDLAALSQVATVQPRVGSRSLLTEVSISIITVGIVNSRLSIALLPGSPEEEKESAAYESCAPACSAYNPSDKSDIAVFFLRLRVVNSIRALVTDRGAISL
jgi:hypothetical protein